MTTATTWTSVFKGRLVGLTATSLMPTREDEVALFGDTNPNCEIVPVYSESLFKVIKEAGVADNEDSNTTPCHLLSSRPVFLVHRTQALGPHPLDSKEDGDTDGDTPLAPTPAVRDLAEFQQRPFLVKVLDVIEPQDRDAQIKSFIEEEKETGNRGARHATVADADEFNEYQTLRWADLARASCVNRLEVINTKDLEVYLRRPLDSLDSAVLSHLLHYQKHKRTTATAAPTPSAAVDKDEK